MIFLWNRKLYNMSETNEVTRTTKSTEQPPPKFYSHPALHNHSTFESLCGKYYRSVFNCRKVFYTTYLTQKYICLTYKINWDRKLDYFWINELINNHNVHWRLGKYILFSNKISFIVNSFLNKQTHKSAHNSQPAVFIC